MKTHFDCITCMLNGLISLFKQGLIEEKYQETVIKEVLAYYANIDFSQSPLLTNRNLHRVIRKIANNPDPYKKLKDNMNKEAVKYCEKYKDIVLKSDNPLDKALRIAVAGNVIDFGPGHSIEIEKNIEKLLNEDFVIDDSQELFNDLKKVKNILYLGDNTGEIVFDKLFLEVIGRNDITFVVRNSPILNDATMEDVKFFGIDKLVNVMTNGDDAPGTLLEFTSPEFKEIFDKADLIISKGQGNFEGLSEIKNKNIYFLLMIKCHIIANSVGLKNGDYIVKSALKNKDFAIK
ncbi:MAG: hypothetical protein A2039_01815 [Candidatus Melainabacteria bacterium GWA2_34_9]|nr:MAG: hypothetical protein A2039_01815 [Candidatus Melainabacteria bacterium GWA2_34_9]